MRTTLSTVAGLWAVLVTQMISADTLNIVVSNIGSSDGTIMLQILAAESEFKGDTPAIAAQTQRARAGTMTFTAANLPAGEYAVRVMHDKNDNGELDSNFVGVPTEPWAFSNNASGKFGPPKWRDAKFTLQGTTTQEVTLNK